VIVTVMVLPRSAVPTVYVEPVAPVIAVVPAVHW
jgi:hypothetical protein